MTAFWRRQLCIGLPPKIALLQKQHCSGQLDVRVLRLGRQPDLLALDLPSQVFLVLLEQLGIDFLGARKLSIGAIDQSLLLAVTRLCC